MKPILAATVLAIHAASAELIRHWPFDGTFDEEIADDSGVPVNGASFGPDRFGEPGKALAVDGSLEQYVEIAGGGGLNNLQEGSLSMFVRWSGPQDSTGFNSNANVTGRQKNSFFNNQVIGLSSSNPSSGRVTWQPYVFASKLTGTTPVGDGTWRHIVVTYAPGAHTLYIDGEIDATNALTGTIQNDPGVALTIGAWIDHGAGYANARIDDVRIYDHVLSQTEVRGLLPIDGLTISIEESPAPQATLEWDSAPGDLFRVLYTEDFTAWHNDLAGNLITGQPGQNRARFRDMIDSIDRRFYSVARVTPGFENIAIGKPATSNAHWSGNSPDKAFDGDRDTQWSSTDHGQPDPDQNWLKLDLQSIVPIGQIFLWFAYSNGDYDGYDNQYELYGSVDDIDYMLISEGQLFDSAVHEERSDTIVLPEGAREYRYLRYDVIGGRHWSGLAEFEVYTPLE